MGQAHIHRFHVVTALRPLRIFWSNDAEFVKKLPCQRSLGRCFHVLSRVGVPVLTVFGPDASTLVSAAAGEKSLHSGIVIIPP